MNDYNIKKLYEEMELELLSSMQRNLSRHLKEEEDTGFKYTQWQAEKLKELKRFQKENKEIVGKYVKGLDKEVSKHLQNELKQGSIETIKQYNKLFKDNKNPSRLMNKSFFRTNDRKVKALIKSVNNDLNKANISALRMINDEYRQIIHKSAFFVANGVQTEKKATDMAIKEISERKATMLACDEVSKSFLAGGLNCIEYKNGRRVNIASYAAMAVRTASLRAHLMGEGDFRKSIGRTLIKVSTHGGTCELCAKWQGKVLIDDVYSGGEPDGKHILLSKAMKKGLFHPNCRHGIFTYYPELEGISYDEDEGDEYLPDSIKEQYNYYDRLGKSWNRRSKGYINPNNKKEARSNYLACEKKKDEILMVETMPYEDITKNIISKAIGNDDEIPEIFKYKKYNEKNAVFDSKDITDVERKTTQKVQKTIGGHFNLIHRIQNMSTPDSEYKNELLFKNKRYFEIKSPRKSETDNSKRHKISRQLNEAKHQSKNVIISLLREECDLTNIEANQQLVQCLNSKEYNWIDHVILVGKDDYFKIYKKKKRP